MSYVLGLIILFIVFSVGLNLGLHGVINLHGTLSSNEGQPLKTPETLSVVSGGSSRVTAEGVEGDLPRDSTSGGGGLDNNNRAGGHRNTDEHTVKKESPPLIARDTSSTTTSHTRTVSQSHRGAHRTGSHDAQNSVATTTETVTAMLKQQQQQQQSQQQSQSVKTGADCARTLVDEATSVSTTYRAAVDTVASNLKDESRHITSRDDISSFVSKGGNLPVVMMTCNRAELLKTTLSSLFSVNGVSKANVLVLQDGKNAEVATVVREHGLRLVQHEPSSHLRGADGATRIAMHYKYALTQAFDAFPDAPAVVIVEDDLLFSPDFLEYFEQVAPVLDVDDSTFLVSAWNDNGYTGKVDDPYALRRTEFFPGLGWLLPRKLYKAELEPKWPTAHWDHWLRSAPINKGREIVFPQVPRTFHNGIRGTFMDQGTHNRYFRDIAYNQDRQLSWVQSSTHPISINGATVNGDVSASGGASGSGDGVPVYAQAVNSVYEARIESLVSKCTHLHHASDLLTARGVLCIWLDLPPEAQYGRAQPPFQPVAEFFGIWHEHARGVHKGLHEFYFGDGASQYVLLLNMHEGPQQQALARLHGRGSKTNDNGGGRRSYRALKPHDAAAVSPDEFTTDLRQRLRDTGSERALLAAGGTLVAAPQPGMSCETVCAARSMHCRANLLPLANSCTALKSLFKCEGGCTASIGAEQPAVVDDSAPAGHVRGQCVYTSDPAASTCDAVHKYTKRACVCS